MTSHHQLITSLNSLFRKEKCKKAVEFFKNFIETSIPTDEDKAEEIFLDVIAMTKLWPDNEKSKSCFLIRGMAFQELKQFEKAVAQFEEAILCQ